MKLRDEIKESWGLVVPDDQIAYETDDAFVTKGGMGINRNVETFWRNAHPTIEVKVDAESMEQERLKCPE